MSALPSNLTMNAKTALNFAGYSGNTDWPFSGHDVLNQAGRFLVSAYEWKWLEVPSVLVAARTSITLSTATWTAATKTLTQTSAFANYTFVQGDYVTITSGTGATTGQHTIVSRTDDDSIVLETSVAAGDLATGDIAGTLDLQSAALPDDFGELLGYNATDSLVNSLTLTTLDHLLSLRTNQISVAAWNFWGAVSWAPKSGGGEPKPVLQLWPGPSTNDFDALTIFYRATWKAVTDDSDTLSIPSWIEDLYLQLVRAYTLGYSEDDAASLDTRLMQILGGPLWAMKVRQDERVQPNLGRWTGGIVDGQPVGTNRYLRTTVAGPS